MADGTIILARGARAPAVGVTCLGPNSSKAADRVGLVLMDVEHGIQFGDLEQVLDAMRQVQQLQMTAAVGDAGIGRDKLSDPRAVDIGNVFEVQKNVLMAILHQVAKGVAEGARSFAQGDPARHIDYGDVPYLSSSQLYTHGSPRFKLNCWIFRSGPNF